MNTSPVDLMTLADIRLTDRQPVPDQPARPAQPDLAPLPRRATVMIVDDERPVLGMLERVLRLENYDLLTAESGPDALRVARERWLAWFERQYLEDLLARHDNNVSACARAAGVDRMHLYRLLWRRGLR